MHSKSKYAIALIALTLVVLALRLLVSYQVAEPGYGSYFTLLQAESIHETGLPRFNDPYSYQGRTYAFDPAFSYIVAFFTLFLPEVLVVKLLPNLFMVLLIPLVYLLGFSMTRNRGVSLIAAVFAGLSPALFTQSLNTAKPLSLALPVIAALLFALFDLEANPTRTLLLTAALTLLSPLVWLVLIAELVYLIILSSERFKIGTAHLEVALITLLMAAWYTLVIYKQALLRHGLTIFIESLPASVRAATFSEFTLLAMLYAVGVIPLALGSLAIYQTTFEQRSRKVLLLASVGLVTLLSALFRLLPLEYTLVLLSLLFTVLAAPGLHTIITYLRRTRFEYLKHFVVIGILLFFLLTSLLPALVQGLYPGSTPTSAELDAMHWLNKEAPRDALILNSPKSGFLINHEAQRAYMADENYLLISNPENILSEIDTAYTTPRTVGAVEILTKYGVTHILVGPREHARYERLGAILHDACFPRLYENPQVLILGVNCTLAPPETREVRS